MNRHTTRITVLIAADDARPYATVDDLTAISGITQSAVDGWEVVV